MHLRCPPATVAHVLVMVPVLPRGYHYYNTAMLTTLIIDHCHPSWYEHQEGGDDICKFYQWGYVKSTPDAPVCSSE